MRKDLQATKNYSLSPHTQCYRQQRNNDPDTPSMLICSMWRRCESRDRRWSRHPPTAPCLWQHFERPGTCGYGNHTHAYYPHLAHDFQAAAAVGSSALLSTGSISIVCCDVSSASGIRWARFQETRKGLHTKLKPFSISETRCRISEKHHQKHSDSRNEYHSYDI